MQRMARISIKMKNWLNKSWTKRGLIICLGMSLSVGIYSDVGTTSVSNMSDQFFEKAAKQREKSSTKKTLRQAEHYFQKAVKSYHSGNKGKAQEYYCKALSLLSIVDMDLAMKDSLVDDYQNIFSKLNHSAVVHSAAEEEPFDRYTIAMDTDNETVQKYFGIYTSGTARTNIQAALERSGQYRAMIMDILEEYNLPEELVYLPVVESLYKNNAYSPAGAVGLWQLMPDRARALGLKVNYWVDERRDPEKATRAAAKYLKDLHMLFDDWHLALSAYNRGEYGLIRDLEFSKATKVDVLSERNALPRETSNFVPQFIVAALIGDNPEKYGFTITYEKPVAYDTVIVNDPIDLNIVAECSATTVKKVRELNPSINAWCTPVNYKDFALKLQNGTKDDFAARIAKVADLNPSRGYVRYKVQKGDCLSKIAKRFCTSVTALKEDNKINRSVYLRPNQILVVRPGRKYFSVHN